MSDAPDPLARAAAQPLQTLGEGCLRRYDPQQLTDAHGTEFAGAEQLWQRLAAAEEAARRR